MSHSLRTGTTLELAIDAVAHGGDGVGRVGELVCFVSGALPGDIVRARVYRLGKRAVWARLLAVVTPSPHRMGDSICDAQACASACVWHAFAYPAQGEWKQRIVRETLARLGHVTAEVEFMETPALRLGYRTRATFHGDGQRIGYYAQRTHDVIPLTSCPLNHPRLNEALNALQPLGVKGDVHVTVNPEGNEILLWMRHPGESVRAAFPMANAMTDAERHRFFFDGAPIVNGAFSQSSLLLNRMLRCETDACIGQAESLLDLYCGNGNLSLHHASHAEVVGVDHAGPAVEAASALGAGDYRRGDESVMTTLIAERSWDVIMLDPPRVGAAPLMEALGVAHANAIVYVSCNPATLARDLHILCSHGWDLIRATAIDMFPHTPHIESVCLLRRR